MSKSGLIYHFPSRHEMLIDIHAWSAQRWEDELIAIAGAPADALDAKHRLRAGILSLGKNDPLAELILSIHTQSHPDFAQQWAPVDNKWIPNASDPNSSPEMLEPSLIANGLWFMTTSRSAHRLCPTASSWWTIFSRVSNKFSCHTET